MIDVFSRTALVWELNMTMKAKDAVRLVRKLINDWLFPMNLDPKKLSIKIRTDNGSQFIAKVFKESLQGAQISNEYIRPATPQQNAHIESFHNTLSRLVCGKYYFEDTQEAQEVLERFFYTYNNKRIMKAILGMTPIEFLQAWSEGRIECKIEGREVKYFLREKPTDKKSESLLSDTFLFLNKDNQLFSKFINPYSI
jgi:putative transposase